MYALIGFLVCAAVIVYAGSKLSAYGDIIAEKTGLGRSFIGLVLLATVTSLPEVFTGLSSVFVIDAPDLAVGNVLGSCLINLFILALLDPLSKDQPISSRAGQGHILTAMISIVLLSITASSMIFQNIIPDFGHIGLYSIFIFLIYLIGVRLIYLFEKNNISDAMDQISYEKYNLRQVVLKYIFNAALIIIAAIFIPIFSEELILMSGMSQGFFGTIFVAASTVLPEFVVSIAAVRIGAINLAMGNIFGSNIFNICILALDDIFYFKGPILSHVNSSHLISLFTCIIMTAFISAGIIFKVRKKNFFISIDALTLIIIYLVGMYMLFIYN